MKQKLLLPNTTNFIDILGSLGSKSFEKSTMRIFLTLVNSACELLWLIHSAREWERYRDQCRECDLGLLSATKLGQGYIFTGVCHSVNRGVSAPVGCLLPGGGGSGPGAGAPAPRGVWSGGCLVEAPPPGRPLLWLVRILLECILVIENSVLCPCLRPV